MTISLLHYIPLITGLVSLGIAVTAYNKEISFRLNRRFFWISLSMAVWNIALFFQESVAVTEAGRLFAARVSHLGAAFAAPTGLHFILRFVRTPHRGWLIPLGMSYAVAVLSALLLFTGPLFISAIVPFQYGWHSVWGPFYPALPVNLIIDYALMLTLLGLAYKRSSSNVEKNRILYILIGAIITVVTTLCNFLPALGISIYSPGHVGTLIFQLLILSAVYKYRLMNLRHAVSKTAILLFTWLLIGGGYSLITHFIGGFRHHSGSSDAVALQFLIAGLFILFFLTMQYQLLPRLEKFIYPLRSDGRKLLEALDKALSRSDTPNAAAKALAKTVFDGTKLPVCFVYIRDDEQKPLHLAATEGEPTTPLLKDIGLNSPLLSLKRSLVLEELRRDITLEHWGTTGESAVRALVQAMEQAGVEAVIPLETGHIQYGLLGFARKRFGGVYDPEDLETFRLLAARTALAIAIQTASSRLAKREHLAQMGEMTAMIAHEIKNPLGAIKAAAEQLEQDGSSQQKWPTMIKEEAERLDRTVRTYLSFARPAEIIMDELDIVRLCNRCAELFRTEANLQGFTLTVDDHPPTKVLLDPDAFRQIFFNLARNSLEAKASGTLTVRFIRETEKVLVQFSDNCGGIPTEQMDRLFQPFQTTKTSGTGLGMAISKKLASAMRAKLLVASTCGTGTTTTLELSSSLHKEDTP